MMGGELPAKGGLTHPFLELTFCGSLHFSNIFLEILGGGWCQ